MADRDTTSRDTRNRDTTSRDITSCDTPSRGNRDTPSRDTTTRTTMRSPDSYWLATGPEWNPHGTSGPHTTTSDTTTLPAHTDVCVLGAGVMGTTLAYWLARAGRWPLVLERNSGPAMGSSGRNAGRLIQGGHAQHAVAVDRHGHAEALGIYQATLRNRDLVREVVAREGLEGTRFSTAKLDLAVEEDEALELKRTAEALRADGVAAEWLDPAGARAVFGTDLPDTVLGGLHRPDQDAVHSVAYVRGMAGAAVRAGAELACGVTVTAVEPAPGGGWLVTTDRGPVRADQVVVALNAWTPRLLPELASVITPVRGQLVQTAPVSFRIPQWGLDRGLVYGGQTPDGSLLIGGLRKTVPGHDEGVDLPWDANTPAFSPELADRLAEALPALLPETAGVPVVRAWSGVMAFTPDRCPLVGAWPGAEGLWVIAAFNGHGMPYSQVMPEQLAERILGGPGAGIPAAFDPARFL
ncbi:FAD-binding oxidoreductase [Streptomyces roseicoloratus]|uniref:FAD-binding oxidoreductase n=1 Tax=Streptomyces roseicoloratus TaxID=2508722 RepID=A0ABY9RUY4_9ACTN|nr:FAD-binding oxidoreductase [Streptomyces roseicoloratus]WMX45987.1 FAD-binding oxidoreductase [Streptomyces roseicoloratus]